jgi:hypothetical protein
MKRSALSFGLLVLMAAGSLLPADPDSALATFQTQLLSACQTRNFDGLKALYDFDGIAPASADKTLHRWQEFFDADSPWTCSGVAYATLDELQADPTVDRTMFNRVHPFRVNGVLFGPNLPVVGFVKVEYQQPGKTSATRIPVGIAPDGSYKLTLIRPL